MTSGVKRFFCHWILPFTDPRQLVSLARLPRFLMEMRRFQGLALGESVPWSESYPCLLDRLARTPFDPHYFYQGAWLARKLTFTKPKIHVDVGSSVTMVSVLSARIPIVFLDYRPLNVKLSDLHSVGGNVLSLPFSDHSIYSLSSLHVIEHVGLGRYGDPLEPGGAKRAAIEFQRVLLPGGRLFLSVPVGRERVCFNAHRVFAPATMQSFFPALRLESFSLVDDAGRFREKVPLEAAAHLEYGCGMFEFVKAYG